MHTHMHTHIHVDNVTVYSKQDTKTQNNLIIANSEYKGTEGFTIKDDSNRDETGNDSNS